MFEVFTEILIRKESGNAGIRYEVQCDDYTERFAA